MDRVKQFERDELLDFACIEQEHGAEAHSHADTLLTCVLQVESCSERRRERPITAWS